MAIKIIKGRIVKTKGHIVKWRRNNRFYVRIIHNNGKKEDSNSFKTLAGRWKKIQRLKKVYKGFPEKGN